MTPFWKKTVPSEEATTTLRNELIVKLNNGEYITTWYDDWDKDKDPREKWKDFYNWYMNEDTPMFMFGKDADPYTAGVADWVVTRKIITQFYFKVYAVQKEKNEDV